MQIIKANKQIVFQKPPKDFISKFEIVSCHIEKNEQLLFLKRANSESQPNTWGVPAGKKEENETIEKAIIREVLEETTIQLTPRFLNYFTKVYVRYPDYDFIYHIFVYKPSNQEINIALNPIEHVSYKWVSIKDAISGVLPFILGEEECVRLIYEANNI